MLEHHRPARAKPGRVAIVGARGFKRAADPKLTMPETEGAIEELIAGKTIPFALIGLADALLVTAAAVVWVKVPFMGTFSLLRLARLLHIRSAPGIGLLLPAN